MIPRKSLLSAFILLASASMAQTAPTQTPAPSPTPAALPDAPSTTTAPPVPQVPTGPNVVFDTSMGRLTCKLFDKQSPVASANFIGLAEGTRDWTDPATGSKMTKTRFYDGTTFHRVIPAFMIQGGDHKGDGTGDGGYFFDNETTPGLTFDVPGRLAMANAGPNTNGTQFFITELAQPELDGKYTIFGQCDSHSVLMVATISRVERTSQDKPLTPVILQKVTIVREGEPMPAPPATPAPAPPASAPVASPLPPAPK